MAVLYQTVIFQIKALQKYCIFIRTKPKCIYFSGCRQVYLTFSEIKNRIEPTKPKLPISTPRTYFARLQKNSLFLKIMRIFTEYFAVSHFFSSKTVFNVIPLKRMY